MSVLSPAVRVSSRVVAHWLTLVLAALGSALALLLPTYAVATSHSGAAGERTTSVSLLAQMGPAAIPLALIPVVIAAIPLILAGRGRHGTSTSATTAALLVVWVLLGAWTIGVFSAPAALCAVAAAFLPSNDRRRPAITGIRDDGAAI